MTEHLKEMITDYKNKGERVDEVIFQEVMKVIVKLEKEVSHWKKGFENENKIARKLQNKNERLEKENDRLKVAEQAYEAMKKAL